MLISVTTPNGEIKIVSNLSKEWARSVLDGGISYREDVDQIIELLEQIGKELVAEEPWKSALLEPLQIFEGERFGESQLVIRGVVKTINPLKTMGGGKGTAEEDQNSIWWKRNWNPVSTPCLDLGGQRKKN